MVAVLLLLIPLLAGLVSFFIRNDNQVRSWALLSAIITLLVSFWGLTTGDASLLAFKGEWLPFLGSSFYVKLDGMGQMLCLLTAIAFPLIIAATWATSYKKPNNFFGLLLLAQAGLMGVFLSMDALLFYFFWELALIPAYFLCSQWGGEKRIAVTFKFFIYTFTGSVLMLVGLLYLNAQTPTGSFALEEFYALKLSTGQQTWLFWLLFIAFAVKMPVFPFHTWQPDTYEQSPTAVTMVLSGIMVKMGVFALFRWLIPVVPLGANLNAAMVSVLCVIGILYASLVAMRQDDLKRLIAYSSIAHIGLMALAAFSGNLTGTQGVMIQMFNHGINIIGLWIVVEIIERNFGTRKMSELGGLAQKAPGLAILLVIVALANIALPLTNAFVGEFMMFNGIFDTDVYAGSYTWFGTYTIHTNKMGILFAALAGISIILAAVYTLNMIQKVLYGNTNTLTAAATDIAWNEKAVLAVVVVAIFLVGVYSRPLLELTSDVAEAVVKKSDVKLLLSK